MTPSSPPAEPDPAARAAAARLCPETVVALHPGGRGGNSRLYRVEGASGAVYALKHYPRFTHDRRDRLDTEWRALTFLAEAGEAAVPRPLARDAATGFALLSWIEGTPVGVADEADLAAAAAFAGRLHTLARHPAAARLPLASEACLAPATVLEQVDHRLERLEGAASAQPDLAALLAGEIRPWRHRVGAWLTAEAAALDLDPAQDLPAARRTLSPSDFGFHNALRRPDGGLTFLDFEYFGWDDPVKLLADFILHPGMDLTPAQAGRFLAPAARHYAADPALERRLRISLPLYTLRWCLIVLNEFLPERWQGRAFAGQAAERGAVLDRQAAKARALLNRLPSLLMDPPT